MRKQIREHLVHRNTVLYSWIISYLIILCLPFCISSILMQLLIQSVRQETQEAYRNELLNTQILLDEKLSEMSRMALEFSLNKEGDRLVSLSGLSAQEHYSFYLLQQRFQDYSISNHYISSIALYLPDLQTCITNKSCYTGTLFHDYCIENLPSEAYPEKSFQNTYYVLPDSGILYLLSLPLIANSPDNAYLAVTMELSVLDTLPFSIANHMLSIRSDSDNNELLLPTASNTFDSEKKSSVLSIASDISGFTYSLYVPEKEYVSRFQNTQFLILLCNLSSMAISVLLAYYFARKNYKPLIKLLAKVGAGTCSQNEYNLLENHIDNITQKSSEIEKELTRNKLALSDYYLRRFLTRAHTAQEWPAIQAIPIVKAINMQTKTAAVLILDLQDCGQLFHEQGDQQENLSLIRFIITNVMSELIPDTLQYKNIIDDSLFIAIFHGDSEEISAILDSLKQILLPLLVSYNASIRIGVSRQQTITSVTSLPDFYKEAAEALEYCRIFNLNWADYNINWSCGHHFTKDYQQLTGITYKFQNAIAVSEFSRAAEYIDQLFLLHFYQGQPLSDVRLNMYSIISLFRSCLMKLDDKNFPVSVEKQMEALLNCTTIEELKDTLRSNLEKLSEGLEQQTHTRTARLIQQIYDYIDQNYQCYDLSVNSISAAFQMSPASISKLFKRETNTGLLDHINHVRVQHAKELLLSQTYSVSQVTELVGYTNVSSFIRIYKKYEGISPGMVKQQN